MSTSTTVRLGQPPLSEKVNVNVPDVPLPQLGPTVAGAGIDGVAPTITGLGVETRLPAKTTTSYRAFGASDGGTWATICEGLTEESCAWTPPIRTVVPDAAVPRLAPE